MPCGVIWALPKVLQKMNKTTVNPEQQSGVASELAAKLVSRSARVGVIGLGYVGLPLAVAASRANFTVTGFDIDPAKIDAITTGRSYINAVKDSDLTKFIDARRLTATSDFSALSQCDVIVICVPTPLTPQREPEMKYIGATAREIAANLHAGQLVILESTSYPGTTTGFLKPLLEATGLRSGQDFFLGFSPEREDPGNAVFSTSNIPKIVAGDGPLASRLVEQFYGAVVEVTVPVSSTETAEAVKLTENIFRAVNIALVNELKMVFGEMDIDIWEVIDAAKTKPFGFMPFYPGPGLGGHCIPIDPFYLSWRAREFESPARFIELAGEINVVMPRYVVQRATEALNSQAKLALSCAKVLILGLAYKKNVADIRESPSLKLIELFEQQGSHVDYHDPHVPSVPKTRDHSALAGRSSVPLSEETLGGYDLVLVSTDHDAVDYSFVAKHARLCVDTRNAFAKAGIRSPHIVKA